MVSRYTVFAFSLSLLWGQALSAAPMAGAPLLEYSQDNSIFHSFEAAVGKQRVKNYYDYFGLSGHPAFGTVREVATVALYWDFKRGALSLIDINGSARHGFRNATGDVTYDFSGLATSVYLNVADDPKDISYQSGASTAHAHFQYKSSTDGMVLSGLEKKTFNIRLALSSKIGITSLRLLDGDINHGGTFINLDLTKPIYLKMASLPTGNPGGGPGSVPPDTGGSGGGTTPGGTPGVPEPGVALAAALLGLVICRRSR